MRPINNYIGYVVAAREGDTHDPGLSGVVTSKPIGAWIVGEPFTVYESLDTLREATPDFDPKLTHVLEVIVHILGEDVKKVSI